MRTLSNNNNNDEGDDFLNVSQFNKKQMRRRRRLKTNERPSAIYLDKFPSEHKTIIHQVKETKEK